MENFEERGEELKMIANKIQNSRLQFPDIRERKWSQIDSEPAKLLDLLIQAENIFIDLDDYQMNNNQCYPEIEDMMLQIGDLRSKYTDFVEKNKEILKINSK